MKGKEIFFVIFLIGTCVFCLFKIKEKKIHGVEKKDPVVIIRNPILTTSDEGVNLYQNEEVIVLENTNEYPVVIKCVSTWARAEWTLWVDPISAKGSKKIEHRDSYYAFYIYVKGELVGFVEP